MKMSIREHVEWMPVLKNSTAEDMKSFLKFIRKQIFSLEPQVNTISLAKNEYTMSYEINFTI